MNLDDTPPVEQPRDVFLLLLDAYREEREGQIRRLWAGYLKDRIRAQLDADCAGWKARYEAAKLREPKP